MVTYKTLKTILPFVKIVPRSKLNDEGKRIRPCRAHGAFKRRIILDIKRLQNYNTGHGDIIGQRDYNIQYHATKGWRERLWA